MPLELNGQPYSLSFEQTKQYTGRFIFRVGQQYIKVNTDRELKHVEVAPVHINTMYQHYELKDKVRMSKGILRYYEIKDVDDNGKKASYSPSRIPIGYTGSITVENPELAFFLDNHPNNEKVKVDSTHPNFSPDVQSYFATYQKERLRKVQLSQMEVMKKLLDRVLDKQDTGLHELKAIAQLVVKAASDYHISHKLFSMNDMNEDDFRAELSRLVSVYPNAMQEIMESSKVNFLEWINKFKEVELIKIKGSEWVISESGKTDIPLVRVEPGSDAVATLSDWFQNFDKMNKKFKNLKELYQGISERRTAKAK